MDVVATSPILDMLRACVSKFRDLTGSRQNFIIKYRFKILISSRSVLIKYLKYFRFVGHTLIVCSDFLCFVFLCRQLTLRIGHQYLTVLFWIIIKPNYF